MGFLKNLIWPTATQGQTKNNLTTPIAYECEAPVTAGYSAPLKAHSHFSDDINPQERKKLIIKESRPNLGLFTAEVVVLHPDVHKWGPDGFLVSAKPAPITEILSAADKIYADAPSPIKNQYLAVKARISADMGFSPVSAESPVPKVA